MSSLLSELGKKLADRWLTLLALPGTLFLAVLAAARALGNDMAHLLDPSRLTGQIQTWAAAPATTSAPSLAVILLAALIASAGVGLAAQALGSLIERWWWLAEDWENWSALFRTLADWRANSRRKRWADRDSTYQEHLANARKLRTARAALDKRDQKTLAEARRKVFRIATEQPDRPTWIGDRVRAIAIRLDSDHKLDLPTVWPHLWLTLPDTTRAEITAARSALTRATTLAGWGLLYIAIGPWWWPGFLLAAAILITGWRRARSATDVYVQLIEATTRIHTTDLATTIGVENNGLLDDKVGWSVTLVLQGQANLIPFTTGWPSSARDRAQRTTQSNTGIAGQGP